MDKTQEQIDAEVNSCKELKGELPEFSPLGEPIHRAIDAQVQALQTGSWSAIALSDQEDDFIYNCVLDAFDWRSGDPDAVPSVVTSWQWAMLPDDAQ